MGGGEGTGAWEDKTSGRGGLFDLIKSTRAMVEEIRVRAVMLVMRRLRRESIGADALY